MDAINLRKRSLAKVEDIWEEKIKSFFPFFCAGNGLKSQVKKL
jgi:hypothetical protein